MITVTETNEKFASRTDPYYGPALRKGYTYMARLQYIPTHIDLCPSNNDNSARTLVLPYDGLAIALLVKAGGGCSLVEKADFIRNFVNIPNFVHFLILDSSDLALEEDMLQEEDEQPPIFFQVPSRAEVATKQYFHREQTLVPQTILYVSSTNHYQLLDMLARESRESYESGGIQIALDSRLGTGGMSSLSIMWIAFSALLGACCCSFFLILSSRWMEEPPMPPPSRPIRPPTRRLTREQVKRLFPIYQFNGQDLQLIEEIAPKRKINKDQEPFVPRPLELSCCSICLDEYEPGDRLRCLDPCHHAFHARCIGRWLSERSATCPLCKTELYDPDEGNEEEDSSSSEGEQQQQPLNQQAAPTLSATSSLFYFPFSPMHSTRVGGATDGQAPVQPLSQEQLQPLVNSPATAFELSDNASTVMEQRHRPWFRTLRRWLSLGNTNGNREDSPLRQPLLVDVESVVPSAEGSLMVPLEATLPNTFLTESEEVIPDPPENNQARQVTV